MIPEPHRGMINCSCRAGTSTSSSRSLPATVTRGVFDRADIGRRPMPAAPKPACPQLYEDYLILSTQFIRSQGQEWDAVFVLNLVDAVSLRIWQATNPSR